MRKLVLAVVTFCCFTLFATAQNYHPGYQDGAVWLKLKPSEELLTKKKEKLSVDDIQVLKPLKEKYKLKHVEKPFRNIRKASPLQNTYLLTFDEIHEADKLIKELEKSGVLEYAEKVPLNKSSVTPNDEKLSTQWHLDKINAQGAWDIHTASSNTVIAIVDDAIETTHPDLSPNIWVNTKETAGNGIDDDGNGYVDDVQGWDFGNNDNNPDPPTSDYYHGTHVAGIASAATNNTVGIASIGYSARLMCIKAASKPRIISFGYEGIVYAADNGADIINTSWGSSYSSITGQNVINYALNKGCIVVASAGNDYMEKNNYPAAYPGVVNVAATNNNDLKSGFSNYGSAITISAPGESIYSTYINGSYNTLSGTSMAAPLVAGLLALMQSYNPSMPDASLINCLKSSATNIDASNAAYAGKLGAGRIDATAAMQCVGSTLNTLPTANFSASQTTVAAGGTISFKNLSTYATSWSWSFPGGTPSSSTEKEPTVVYNSIGSYNVSLSVTNGNGSDDEIKTNYITITSGTSCIKENYPVPAGWIAKNYYFNGIGWMNGVNNYGDLQKAMFYDASTSAVTHITSVLVKFGYAYSSDRSKTVKVNIYDGTAGMPTKLLQSENLTMGEIMDSVAVGKYTSLNFKEPVALPVSKKYFVSVDMSDLYGSSSTDPLFIWSNTDGQTTLGAAWEQWSDSSWHAYNSQECWDINLSLYIHPFLTYQPTVATFTPSATTICAGNSVSFDAAGSTYSTSLNWSFVSGNPASVSGDPTPTILFNTPGTHQVTLTVQGGGCDEVRDSTITINVNENVTPSVTLASSTDAPGVPVTFTATPVNGGQNPVFAFKKNGDLMQSGSSNTWSSTGLTDSDVVSCTLSSDHSCVTTSTANSNSITIDATTMTVLPVELLYFKGSAGSGTNLLQWATTSETNTSKFIVEQSTDGTRFYEAGTVKANGESSETITYQFQDTRTTSAYYRLRIIDTDGSFTFSNVVYLGAKSGAGFMIWPNPATSGQEVRLVLTGRSAKQEMIQVIDAYGKVIVRRTVALKSGKLETGIPTQQLAPGVYFITITDESSGRIDKEKLVIMK
jgi:serine protease